MDYRTAIQNKKMKKDEKWEYLYTSTYRDMYYTVWNLIDDKSEIEDILQNAYMHAYKKIDSLNDPDKFPAWMKRIVINMAFKYQKKKKPSLFPESVGESDQPEPEIADERPDTDPVYFLEDAEARDLLSALIDNLPIEQKQPLLLYHYEGISLAEIAKLLNCSINTVKSRLRYARKKLRENLEELREKGYSFNGVSPVSLVVGLLEKGRNSKEIAAAAERSSAVVFKTSAKWAAAETAASGSVTAIKVAGTTAGGIAMRIASGALATAFIGGAMYGVYKVERNSIRDDISDPLPYVETTDTPIDAYNDQVVVPDVEGLTIDNAKDVLNAAGFEYKVTIEDSSSAEEGTVISQFPIAGERENIGYTVTIVVSKNLSLDTIHNSRKVNSLFSMVSCSGNLPTETVNGVTYTFDQMNVISLDGKCWAEDKPGVGKGEYIEFSNNFENGTPVSGIGIWNGWDNTSEQFYDYGRVTKVRITTDNDSFDLPLISDMMGEQYFEFGKTVYTNTLRITILDAVEGDKYDDTCISLIVPYQ